MKPGCRWCDTSHFDCGPHLLVDPEGFIHSPNYPNWMRTPFVCEWRFDGGGTKVSIYSQLKNYTEKLDLGAFHGARTKMYQNSELYYKGSTCRRVISSHITTLGLSTLHTVMIIFQLFQIYKFSVIDWEFEQFSRPGNGPKISIYNNGNLLEELFVYHSVEKPTLPYIHGEDIIMRLVYVNSDSSEMNFKINFQILTARPALPQYNPWNVTGQHKHNDASK